MSVHGVMRRAVPVAAGLVALLVVIGLWSPPVLDLLNPNHWVLQRRELAREVVRIRAHAPPLPNGRLAFAAKDGRGGAVFLSLDDQHRNGDILNAVTVNAVVAPSDRPSRVVELEVVQITYDCKHRLLTYGFGADYDPAGRFLRARDIGQGGAALPIYTQMDLDELVASAACEGALPPPVREFHGYGAAVKATLALVGR